ncbi:MAG: ABC transporter permease [Deltaproteobacteria bacterium]|nr:ABC transporter permease [Deltaproteobacteria bacterium]
MIRAVQQRLHFAAIVLGTKILSLHRHFAACFGILLRTWFFTIKGQWRMKEIFRQAHNIGNRSVVFITAVFSFLGMILVLQTGEQAQRIIGDLNLLGATMMPLIVRDFGPSICGLMIATRVGSGIAAEIGSMVVTDQVDALRMSAADPVDYLVTPRFIATTVMMVALAVFAVLITMSVGALTAKTSFGVPINVFLDTMLVKPSDVATGVAKAIAYGMAIPVIAGYCGLVTRGGSEGVGWATTNSVVATSFAVITLNLIISAIAYLFTGGA